MTIILNNKCGSYSRKVASIESAETLIREEMKAGRANRADIRNENNQSNRKGKKKRKGQRNY